MRKWLPEVQANGDYVRAPLGNLDDWISGIREIAARHHLPTENISSFAKGQNPVFALSEGIVLKLIPRRLEYLVAREVRCLEWLSRCSEVPLPKLLGSGHLEDWSYVLSTRLLGIPLHDEWRRLNGRDQEAIAAELGRTLRKLHEIPVGDFSPGSVPWEDFLKQRAAMWLSAPGVGRLSPRLRETGADYIAQALCSQAAFNPVFLHGDLAPENCLVSDVGGSWKISGVFDFGNAMVGHSLFDFTALTVLLAPGSVRILRQVLGGYGLVASAASEQRALLMAYTLLHPLGDISAILDSMHGLSQAESWHEVAAKFWPAAAL